jgi:hypothetical protein
MELYKLKKTPLWQMTGEEFLFLQTNSILPNVEPSLFIQQPKKYVYGITGLATLFDCSKPTANRIKKSRKIDDAITQIGRKIIIDADLALKLAGRKTGGKK